MSASEHAPSPAEPGRGARVLIVHADAAVRSAVAAALRHAGFEVAEASTASAGRRALGRFRPDLVVLDLVLPDGDGLRLAGALSETLPRTPAIFLTARDAPEDRIAGLALADDYVATRSPPAEVVARVRAIVRRTRRDENGVLRFADVVLDDVTHEVRRAGRVVPLTPREFALLRFFLRNPGRVLSRDQILAHVWEDAGERDARSVETYVSYLRRKLDRVGTPLIETVRSVGYALREPRS